ncbi:hypothetical protein Pint_20529 [Pistacia integerrima]|uniref:Uncharacterized protein n=1 Tax=Pistacia integerrima TaxID=434235 RepID=A0ACC0XCH6_9ROSI|nr:hypothetical protein Pint_20529 [Pistacia integerrima]
MIGSHPEKRELLAEPAAAVMLTSLENYQVQPQAEDEDDQWLCPYFRKKVKPKSPKLQES